MVTASEALARGRALAETLMVDTCTVTRESAAFTNPDTGQQTISTATVYTGRCKVQHRTSGGARDEDVAEANLLMLRLSVHLPVSATGVRTGDIITVTASVGDAELVGRRFIVRELAHKSMATARRFGVEEVT
jgi:hypothetical protein